MSVAEPALLGAGDIAGDVAYPAAHADQDLVDDVAGLGQHRGRWPGTAPMRGSIVLPARPTAGL